MRKLSKFYLPLLTLATLIFVSSCNNDEENPIPGPSIVLTPDDPDNQELYEGFVGDSVTLNISVEAAEGFNVLRVYRKVDGVKGDPLKEFPRASGTTQGEFTTDYTYTLQEEDVDNTIFLVFEAVDDAGNSSEVQYEIIAADRPTRKYSMKLLYAPTLDGVSETFFSTNDGETYSKNVILEESLSAKIDFGYFYGEDFKATLASPAQYPYPDYTDEWTELNETKIKKTDISASEYIEIQNSVELIDQAFEEATYGLNEGRATELIVGEVLAFELVSDKGSKRGLIKVNGITGTDGIDGYIEIEVVVED